MKKFLIGLFIVGVAAILIIPLVKTQAALGARVSVQGDIKIGKNSQIVLKVKNTSTNREKIKNVTVWIPSGYTIAYPAHNTLIRGLSYGPWSTLIKWNGNSGRSGYNAVWFKVSNGGKYIPFGKYDKLPLTLRTPTNARMYPQVLTLYWQAETSNNQRVRGTTTVNVVR